MPKKPSAKSADPSFMSVPAFWPMAMAAQLFEEGAELYAKNLRFVDEEIKIHEALRTGPRPQPTAARPYESQWCIGERRGESVLVGLPRRWPRPLPPSGAEA